MKLTPIAAAAALMLAMSSPIAFADSVPDDDLDAASGSAYGSAGDDSSSEDSADRGDLSSSGETAPYARFESSSNRVGATTTTTLTPEDYEYAANEMNPASRTMVASAAGTLAKEDREFFEKAAIAGMAEVQAAEIAKTKAVDADTKSFADMMVGDHGKANEELKKLAAAKGVTLPTTLDRKHADMVQELRDKTAGKDFDDKYSNDMEAAHEEAVALFEKTAENAKDADVKAFAQKTLPTLKAHLEMARRMDAEK